MPFYRVAVYHFIGLQLVFDGPRAFYTGSVQISEKALNARWIRLYRLLHKGGSQQSQLDLLSSSMDSVDLFALLSTEKGSLP